MSLLDDLNQAESETTIGKTCSLCEYILGQEDEDTKAGLTRAAAGTIGRDKLIAILKNHETGIGHRTVTRHRTEGHTP